LLSRQGENLTRADAACRATLPRCQIDLRQCGLFSVMVALLHPTPENFIARQCIGKKL
jgi:hypothetical protein